MEKVNNEKKVSPLEKHFGTKTAYLDALMRLHREATSLAECLDPMHRCRVQYSKIKYDMDMLYLTLLVKMKTSENILFSYCVYYDFEDRKVHLRKEETL